MHQIPLDLHRVEAPTLENFVVGGNAEALAQLRAVRDLAGGPRVALVYLWGDPGCGKTHLLSAVASSGTGDGLLLGPDSPQGDYAISAGDGAPPVVALDDCERLDAARQECAFHLINRARASGRTTVVAAGACPPRALALRDDLRTRLGSGLVYRIALLDDAQKAAALGAAAHERGVAIAPDVVPWLIAHTSRDIRALLRAFDVLDRQAFARRRAITLPLVRELQAEGLLPRTHRADRSAGAPPGRPADGPADEPS